MYRYQFEDGFIVVSCLSHNDIAWEETRHGKLVSKTPA